MSSDQNEPPALSSSPVQTKLSSLTSKSSFASFFCKKRPIFNLTTDSVIEEKPREPPSEVNPNFTASSDIITLTDDEDGGAEEVLSTMNRLRSQKIDKRNSQELAYISLSSSESEAELPPPKFIRQESPLKTANEVSPSKASNSDAMDSLIVDGDAPADRGTSVTELCKESNSISAVKLATNSESELQCDDKIFSVPTAVVTKEKETPPIHSLPAGFDSLDPTLREVMLARLNQAKTLAAAEKSKSPTKPNGKNAFAEHSRDFALFSITQRLNRGTFDQNFANNGKLLPSPTFIMVWKMTDTFGAMKRSIASHLRVSPFDLVLTRAEDENELFDTTKPASLNFTGVTYAEYSLYFSKSAHSKASKIANFFKSGGRPNEQLPVHRLFLYTKSTHSQYKLMHEDEKRVLLESLAYLKTADPETRRLSREPIKTDSDEEELSLSSFNQKQSTEISLTVKTSSSRNQSHSISVDPSAKISKILEILQSDHAITAEKIIFDGDVLNMNSAIRDVLEDDDMIEVR